MAACACSRSRHEARDVTSSPPPIIVGVCGHRDLDEAQAAGARRSIGELLRGLQEALAGRARLIAASALAAGADQLFAQQALQIGLAVIAPLPLTPAAYRETFTDARAAAEFDALARKVTCFSVAEWPHSAPLRTDLPAVDAAFQRLGDTLDAASAVLVALWDGAFNDSPGGTGDTVGRRLERDPLSAPIFWIPASRAAAGRAHGVTAKPPGFIRPAHAHGELAPVRPAEIHRLLRLACDGADSPADRPALDALRQRLLRAADLDRWLMRR
jgi:hypothetical protein